MYVKNLDSFTDDHEVEKHFSTCGKVISVNVVRDNFTGLGKGYGFVCFSTPGDANKAVNDLNGSFTFINFSPCPSSLDNFSAWFMSNLFLCMFIQDPCSMGGNCV